MIGWEEEGMETKAYELKEGMGILDGERGEGRRGRTVLQEVIRSPSPVHHISN
jgi:hypothetical protein